jgi:hypothetical protein
LPPSSRTSTPARVASGCAALTIPFVPTAAREAVLVVAGPSRNFEPEDAFPASPCFAPPPVGVGSSAGSGRDVVSSKTALSVTSVVRVGASLSSDAPCGGSA